MQNKTQKADVQTIPSAHLTVRKGRVKIYDKEKQPSKIYLQGGQEFEIELFNPTTLHQLATIEINGKLISNTGIALKPGQRVYLERYLDIAKKFKFDTYEVESGNASVENAIAKNGLIKIKFYAEAPVLRRDIYGTFSSGSTLSNLNSTITIDPKLFGNLNLTNINSTSTNLEYYSTNCTGSINLSNCTGTGSINFSSDLENTSKQIDYSEYLTLEPKDVKMKETGRIEQGENSSQSFDYIDMDFSTYANTTIEYQILPLSEKIVEAKDLKNYCTECGRNLKPEFKFCPVCGTRI
jgi:ribosomal 50S subunit-recycling heat shock protein